MPVKAIAFGLFAVLVAVVIARTSEGIRRQYDLTPELIPSAEVFVPNGFVNDHTIRLCPGSRDRYCSYLRR
jgi:hypothetical protein